MLLEGTKPQGKTDGAPCLSPHRPKIFHEVKTPDRVKEEEEEEEEEDDS
jgi:hypothetical protein